MKMDVISTASLMPDGYTMSDWLWIGPSDSGLSAIVSPLSLAESVTVGVLLFAGEGDTISSPRGFIPFILKTISIYLEVASAG